VPRITPPDGVMPLLAVVFAAIVAMVAGSRLSFPRYLTQVPRRR
jgi:hypothetical protein